LPHGRGQFQSTDGTAYIGEFRNGERHGVGYIVDSNLDTFHVEYING